MIFRSAAPLVAIVAFFYLSPAFGYTAKEVSNGGGLSGKIMFSGPVPDSLKVLIEKNPEICGTGDREIREVTVGSDGGLQHAVVYFKKIDEGKKWPDPEENKWGNPKSWELNEEKCRFLPWVMVVPFKAKLLVINRDPVLHNIHTYELIPSGPNKFIRVTMFNEAQPTQNHAFKKKLRMRCADTIKVECDVHNFMHSYMKVLKNPYWAISAPDGSYAIDQIPAGKYNVIVWHSTLGSISKAVEIKAGETAELNHQFSK